MRKVIDDPKLIVDIIEGLHFCSHGVYRGIRSEYRESLSGVRIDKKVIISSNRFCIMKWNLDEDSNITHTISREFIAVLRKNKDKIIRLECNDVIKVGDIGLEAILEDKTRISDIVTGWLLEGDCIDKGGYPDLFHYFPNSENYKQVEIEDLGINFSVLPIFMKKMLDNGSKFKLFQEDQRWNDLILFGTNKMQFLAPKAGLEELFSTLYKR